MTITVREATSKDAKGIAEVQVKSWLETYTGIIPQDIIDGRTVENRTDLWNRILNQRSENDQKCYIALSKDNQVVGFIDVGPSREYKDHFDSELYAIYLIKEFKGQGVGRRLFDKGIEYLKSKDFNKMYLWVLEDNPTTKVYESLGGVRSQFDKMEDFGCKSVSYSWDLNT